MNAPGLDPLDPSAPGGATLPEDARLISPREAAL